MRVQDISGKDVMKARSLIKRVFEGGHGGPVHPGLSRAVQGLPGGLGGP